MTRMVDTTKGPIAFDRLVIKEVHASGDNDESIAREWYLDGELVRRDAWVTLLRGNPTRAEQGAING